jgi:lambda repressor-like predicted transcriptional regulator
MAHRSEVSRRRAVNSWDSHYQIAAIENKEAPLAEVSRRTVAGSAATAPAALCCHHPHFNGLIAQAIPIQTLASLFRQYLRAIIRSGCKVVYGFCRLQTLPACAL